MCYNIWKKDMVILKYILQADNYYPTNDIYDAIFITHYESNMVLYHICLESALYKGKYQICFDENIKT